MKRKNLKLFRVSHDLTQGQFANKVNVSRAVYSNIERGRTDANQEFWNNLQSVFSIPDAEMWKLQKIDN